MIVSRAEVLTFIGKDTSLTEDEDVLLNLIHPLAEAAICDFLQQQVEQVLHTEFYPAGQVYSGDEDTRLSDYELTGGRLIATRGVSASGDELQLQHLPVISSGLRVWEDTGAHAGYASGAFVADTELTHGSDFWLDQDESGLSHTGILRRSGRWPPEPRSVKVTYYGGWTVAQLDAKNAARVLRYAALLTVAKAFWETRTLRKTGGVGGVTSESIGKYSYSTGGGTGAVNTGMVVALPVEAVELLQTQRSYRLF